MKKQFERLSMQIVKALASAVDAKDRYTNGHSTRVAEYSRKIAELYGKNKKYCDIITSIKLERGDNSCQ